VTAFFWKVLTKQFTWMDHPDMAYQILPWYQFQADLWHRGEFPIWDPRLWGGQPLIAQIVPSGAYPLNWILFLLPLAGGFSICGQPTVPTRPPHENAAPASIEAGRDRFKSRQST